MLQRISVYKHHFIAVLVYLYDKLLEVELLYRREFTFLILPNLRICTDIFSSIYLHQ